MAQERTFIIIKPDAYKHKHKILEFIQNHFDVQLVRDLVLPKETLKKHYAHLKDKPFFDELISDMNKPGVILIAEGENAVARWRELIGPTDPAKAPKGTLRHTYGTSISHNAVHGSDSVENALKEIELWFPTNT